MQFDLSFLKDCLTPGNGEESTDTSKDDSGKEDDQAPMEEETDELMDPPSSTAKILEAQFNNPKMDASLAAVAVGLDLLSVANDDPTEDVCFVTVLAGFDEDLLFAEMFTILDSLIEEAEETDDEVLRKLQEMDIHVPSEIRVLLVEEARESGESVLQHLNKLRDWLCESEEEEAESAGMDRYQEREYDTDGSLLPRPEDYGDKEPQGCDSSRSIPRTTECAQPVLASNEITARLGESQK